MNIKEAEKVTGVSSRNIRFYEQKGLLTPARNKENDYREYSPSDIERLKLIRALRMVDMPLEQIREVINGEVTLQRAATVQKEKLEEQIKRLKTVIKFCGDLSETENVSEVLIRMDEPENRVRLSQKWKLDFTEVTLKITLPITLGLMMFAVNVILACCTFLLFLCPQGYMLTIAVSEILLWGFAGYKLYEKRWWLLKFVLAHIVAVVCFVTALDAVAVHTHYSHPSLMFFAPFYHLKYLFTESLDLSRKELAWAFAVLLVVFVVGMLIRMAVQLRKVVSSSMSKAITDFFEKHEKIARIARCLLVIALLLVPLSINYLGPVGDYVPISKLVYVLNLYPSDNRVEEDKIEGYKMMPGSSFNARIGSDTYEVELKQEFVDLMNPGTWERKYVWFGLGRKAAEIGIFKSGEVMITIYRNDVVYIRTGGGFLEPTRDVYYRLPHGTAKKVIEYIETYKMDNPSE